MNKEKVNIYIHHKDFIDSLDDIDVSLTLKEELATTTINKEPIILDENGEDYILTLCCIDYGGGGPIDCVDDYSFIFRVNDIQLEILKKLTGTIWKGNIYPYEYYTSNNKKKFKNGLFEKISNILSGLGDSKSILKQMKLKEEDLYSTTYGFINPKNNWFE